MFTIINMIAVISIGLVLNIHNIFAISNENGQLYFIKSFVVPRGVTPFAPRQRLCLKAKDKFETWVIDDDTAELNVESSASLARAKLAAAEEARRIAEEAERKRLEEEELERQRLIKENEKLKFLKGEQQDLFVSESKAVEPVSREISAVSSNISDNLLSKDGGG